jgi:hypothetical protein
MLYQIKECEYKYPNEVYKVPIQAYFFNHFIVPSAVIGAQQYIKENNAVNYYT